MTVLIFREITYRASADPDEEVQEERTEWRCVGEYPDRDAIKKMLEEDVDSGRFAIVDAWEFSETVKASRDKSGAVSLRKVG